MTDDYDENVLNYTLIVGLTCFACIIVLLLRINMQPPQQHSQQGSNIPAQLMTGVSNPFTFTLHDDGSGSSLTKGVKVSVSSNVSCILQAFWGVSINEVYDEAYQHWQAFHQQFMCDILFKEISLAYSEKIFIESCNNKLIELEVPPDHRPLELGAKPRSRYPLVVSMIMDFADEDPAQSSVVSMVNFVHVSDDVCPGKSHIITHLVRTTHGQPYTLQPLYVASAPEDDNPSPPTSSHPGDTSPTNETFQAPATGACIVCQTNPINRVVMPCRHACVCDYCFTKLSQCPMCRAAISTYFTLNGNIGAPNNEDNDDAELPNEGWWSKLNSKLNRMLGV